MCWCRPEVRTPNCGGPNCHPPIAKPVKAQVIDIEEAMPHFCIIGPKNEPHVVPVDCIVAMAEGRIELTREGQLNCDIDLIQGILIDWLRQQGIETSVAITPLRMVGPNTPPTDE